MVERVSNEELLTILKGIKNGGARLTVWHWAIQVIPILLVVVAAAWTIGIRLGDLESDVSTLKEFAKRGDRYTAVQGAALEQRVQSLERFRETAPPQLFRDKVDVLDRTFNSKIEALERKFERLSNRHIDLEVDVRAKREKQNGR